MTDNKVTVRTFIRSMMKFSVSAWVNLFISVASVMILTRVFTPEIYGVINLFNAASMVLVGIACLGMDNGFFRFYYEPPTGWTAKQLFAKCLTISVGMLLIVSMVALIFFYGEISSRLFNKVSFFLTALLCMNAFSFMILNNYFSQFYRIANDAKHFTVQQILVNFFSKLFVITAALMDPTIETVLFMNTVGLFALMVVYAVIQRKTVIPQQYHWSYAGFWPVVKFSLFAWPLGSILLLNTFMIPFIISQKMDAYWVGIYSSAGFFVAAFGVLQAGFRTYWSAFMYEHYKDEQGKIIKIHSVVEVCIIFVLGGFILLQHIAYMMIGEGFQMSRLFFSLVLIDPLFGLLEQTTNYGPSLVNKNQLYMGVFILAVVMNLVGLWILLPICGIVGAAFASVCAAIVRSMLLLYLGQKYYRSVRSIPETLCGMIFILILGMSNYWLNSMYLFEAAVVGVIFIASALLYRRCILDIVRLVRCHV